MRKTLPLLLTIGAALLGLVAAPTASATITLGQLMPEGDPGNVCVGGPTEAVPGRAPDGEGGPLWTVPADGVITSWSTRTATGDGQELAFKVLRRETAVEPSQIRFTVVGSDGPHVLVPNSINTFETDIRVAAGERLGLNSENGGQIPNSCVFKTDDPEEAAGEFPGDHAVGEAFEGFGGGSNFLSLNLTATLLRAPTISSVLPSSGAASGGASIQIGGTEFARVQKVELGSTAVPFTVDSESSITATVPPGAAGSDQTIVVTTEAGTVSGGPFHYDAAAPPKSEPPQPPHTTTAFALGQPQLNLSAGTAVLPATVPGAGTISVRAVGSGTPTHLRTATLTADGAGTVMVPLRVTAAGKRPLTKKGRIAIVPLVTFTPKDGAASALYRKVTLRLDGRRAGTA